MKKIEIDDLINKIDIVGNGELTIDNINYDVFESKVHIFVIKNDSKEKLQLPYKSKSEMIKDFKENVSNKEIVFLDDIPNKDFEEDYGTRDEPEHNYDHREGWDYAVKEMEDWGDREYNEEMFYSGD